MLRLTREVRFGLSASVAEGGGAGPVRNSYGGHPSVADNGPWVRLAVTVEGELEPRSQYLVNIVDIDRAVRERVVPMLAGEMGRGPLTSRVLLKVVERLDRVFAPARVVGVELQRTPYLAWSWKQEEPAMTRVSCMFEFSAAHRLHNPALSDEENRACFGKCNNPLGHGHNYQVQVTVREGVPLAELERVVDETVIRPYDHKHLNVEVPDFAVLIPSVENIAKSAYRRLRGPLGEKLVSVTVWETPKTWAEYAE